MGGRFDLFEHSRRVPNRYSVSCGTPGHAHARLADGAMQRGSRRAVIIIIAARLTRLPAHWSRFRLKRPSPRAAAARPTGTRPMAAGRR
jgi:hypothetical protein